MLALGDDGAFVLVDLLQRPPGQLGDLLGGGAGADQRLHLPWAERGRGVVTGGARALVPHGRAQRVIERQAVATALVVRQQHVLAVLRQADEAKVLHAH
ncbi:hypothetical protein GCM10025862_15150 [Arsenicicoccus piscis]|uniref:Uncharacterized protein n=1 Tax=Arsenicicoccus piscis TaxID=673954 RepID=A0ABQ6HM22_9MICO|nr:hypothetical protein [Arsenicicoccus piscis]GMA19494.1 hypothetical protein GCM10025862_15150 [Arsenicicoccus piscis]